MAVLGSHCKSGEKKLPGKRWEICYAGLLILALIAGSRNLYGQTATEDQIKAAYLFNFAKFVEWPAEAFSTSEAPMNFCALGRSRTADEIDSLVAGKSIGGHLIKTRHLGKPEEVKNCHVVFVAGGNNKLQQQLLQAAKGLPVLVVGDAPGFARSGGMIGFVVESGRVLFEVNPNLSDESHLKISSKLLALAHIVSRPPSDPHPLAQ